MWSSASALSCIFAGRTIPGFQTHARRKLSCKAISELLSRRTERQEDDVVIHGYVRSVRSMKSQTFVALADGSSIAPLQAVVPAGKAEGLTVGAAVRLRGSWVMSPAKGQSHELRVDELDIIGPSDAKTYPVQKKYQTPEYLRTMAHLRPRTPFNAALLRFRSETMDALVRLFADRGFTQTHPPVITSSDCEGAGQVFAVTRATDPLGSDGVQEPFFRTTRYLTVSCQLHLEALAQAVGKVWSLAPTFRAERSETSRHLSEFYMLEAEMTFVDRVEDVMSMLEDLLRCMVTTLSASPATQELMSRPESPDHASIQTVRRRWDGMMQTAWPRVTYDEAMTLLEKKSDLFEHKPSWANGLRSEHEKYLVRSVGGDRTPVFVTHYPRDIKPFYMLPTLSRPGSGVRAEAESAAGETVECFDLLVPDLCEIAGGSLREHRLGPLLEAMKMHGLPITAGSETGTDQGGTYGSGNGNGNGSLDWYVDLRRWGSPPHGGFGLGFDRLLGYLSGVPTVRDTVAFPRWFGRCDC